MTLDDLIDSLDYDLTALPWVRCYGCGHAWGDHGWAHTRDGDVSEWCLAGYEESDDGYPRFMCRCGEFQ